MQTNFSPVDPKRSLDGAPFFLGSPRRVERAICNLRWAVLGGAVVLVWVAGLAASMGLLLGVAAGIGLVNWGVYAFLRRSETLPAWWGYVSALLDVAMVLAFALLLEEPVHRYVFLFLLPMTTAAMRFGFRGTMVITIVAWAALMTAFLLTFGLPDDWRAQVLFPTLLLVMAGLVMGLLADRVKDWLSEGLRRERHLKQRLTELAVLQEVNRKVYDLQSGDTLQNIVEVCTKVLEFRRAALFLSQKQEGLPERYFSTRPGVRGDDGQELADLHVDRRLFEAMLQAERPFVVDGSQGLDVMAAGPMLEIAVALRTSSGPIGVLVVDCSDRASVSETDVEVLSALANSATMAIENAQIHTMVQWRADHDGLTNLYNHGYFQEALRQEIDLSRENERSLALLMVEVDDFKRYNDAYGHRQGDAVLVGLARALEACVEKWHGTVARYGGDEFVVMLPALDRSGAQEVAQEVLVWVRTSAKANLAQQGLPGVTVSAGAAAYPDDAQEAGSLIEAADRAMYAAKRQGGDRAKSFDQIDLLSSYLPSRPLGVAEDREEEG